LLKGVIDESVLVLIVALERERRIHHHLGDYGMLPTSQFFTVLESGPRCCGRRSDQTGFEAGGVPQVVLAVAAKVHIDESKTGYRPILLTAIDAVLCKPCRGRRRRHSAYAGGNDHRLDW
jgi:hypothetical protein